MTHQQPDGSSPLGGRPYSSPDSAPAYSVRPYSSPPAAPVSPGSAQPGGYALGIDLGTSHTVAVIRWPDGRSRPLLVDGAPVMPSAVFLDEAMHIHIGRDAQRLAQTDPARFEPNPKHRVDQPAVLLGDREVPTTALLAAILRGVAAKAVESVGHLPQAVLTCPAKWGSQRRSMLEDAAAQAGFPPVTLIPEPVAAAHYFAEIMRQPIPVGKSVAVFDFGGGTLDVAVVRHEPGGGFTVLADGGLDDLGGLDIDAALVEYMGRTISTSVPQVWQQLTQPQNGSDRRNRRLFWDDVRGAKEMLSRTTVAPIPVPGVEASLHLTRDELEQLATPMLARAVAETRRVIDSTHQTPEQLAGLFLVGGASRIPLVARMLHAQLGIAPTVLEQPEIPVAEGSLAAAVSARPEPVSPAPAAVPQGPPVVPVIPVVTPPAAAQPEPVSAAKPWYRKKTGWIAIGAGVAALAVLTGWLVYDPYPQNDMQKLTQVGEPVPIPGAEDSVIPSIYEPYATDDTVYFPSETNSELTVTAIDMTTGKKIWTSEALVGTSWSGINARNGFLYAVDKVDNDTVEFTMLDPETGKTSGSLEVGANANQTIVKETLVNFDWDKHQITGYGHAGKQLWKTDIDFDMAAGGWVDNWSHYTEPLNSTKIEDDGRVYVYDTEGNVAVVDVVDKGKIVAQKQVADEGDLIQAYEGKIFVATDDKAYTLTSYDIDADLAQLATVRPEDAGKVTSLNACGETRICAFGDMDDDAAGDRVSVVDFGESDLKVAWQTPKNQLVRGVRPAGESLSVTRVVDVDQEGELTQIYDAAGEKLGDEQDGKFQGIDSGSFLRFPYSSTPSNATESVAFIGLGARDGTLYTLGTQDVVQQCEANSSYLACPTNGGYTTWRFRD